MRGKLTYSSKLPLETRGDRLPVLKGRITSEETLNCLLTIRNVHDTINASALSHQIGSSEPLQKTNIKIFWVLHVRKPKFQM